MIPTLAKENWIRLPILFMLSGGWLAYVVRIKFLSMSTIFCQGCLTGYLAIHATFLVSIALSAVVLFGTIRGKVFAAASGLGSVAICTYGLKLEAVFLALFFVPATTNQRDTGKELAGNPAFAEETLKPVELRPDAYFQNLKAWENVRRMREENLSPIGRDESKK